MDDVLERLAIHEYDPVFVEGVLKHVRNVAGDTVRPDVRTIGYHGTSLETVKTLLRTGNLPGSFLEYPDPHLPKKGDIYFAPLAGKIPPGVTPRHVFQTPQESFDEAEVYANLNSRDVRVLRQLGLDPYDPRYAIWGEEILSPSKGLRNLKTAPPPINELTEEQVEAVYVADEQYKGFVLGLDESIVKDRTVSVGESGDDLRISTMGGLPLDAITEIYPLGAEEENFIESLRK
ncbi:hypothetical protein A3D80_01510 [Candidatus Roizmanbacteria bacterium RIFCSPHIGHO2_02_FULL_40_13b]|nr:MAG: hypothetical protein A3D80_01510 [Candidatus Roizmanbacteria bacterium RIFCSPHIGHO2_02_FULL_40_13b]OGK57241.1 MAG: hypothetical protein A3H83_03925 [Candidatus Roizmanbacteria bacterium RIFCSPLOWO2_02_FULL_39_8]